MFVVPAPSLPVGWSGTVKSQLSNLSIFRSSAVLNILGHLFTIILFCLSIIRLGQTMSACPLTFTNSCFLSSIRCICTDSVCIEICFPSHKFRIATTWIFWHYHYLDLRFCQPSAGEKASRLDLIWFQNKFYNNVSFKIKGRTGFLNSINVLWLGLWIEFLFEPFIFPGSICI